MSAPARDVDEYLAALPEGARATLETLRKMIRAASPEARRGDHQMPTFKHHGWLVAFSASKNHCSLHLMSPAVLDAYKDDLKAYGTSKATIRFPAGKALPAALVKKLVKARIKENEAALSGRRKLAE